jgi:hypothetical protein
VNTDYGPKAPAFDRIQVDALVRIATAEASMVPMIDAVSAFLHPKKTPGQMWGRALRINALLPT